MKLAGISVGPFQEGNEIRRLQLVGEELAEEGIVHFREEDKLDATKLYKVQWKERVQVAGQISELPEDFYPKSADTSKSLNRILRGSLKNPDLPEDQAVGR
jgi:hypothetical protein